MAEHQTGIRPYAPTTPLDPTDKAKHPIGNYLKSHGMFRFFFYTSIFTVSSQEVKMDLIEAIRSRRSIRKFKPDPVPREILEQILLASRWSPSGSNTQPWEFAILGGKVIEEVKNRIEEKIRNGVKMHPDIPYPPMPEPYVSRQREVMRQMSSNLPAAGTGVPAGRYTSARFFEAPNGMIIYLEKELCPRSYLGLGMIAQTICLAALHYGLGTCIMSMVTYWPEIYRELLPIPDSKLIAFGIAIGYPDAGAPVNNFSRTREPLDSFVHWYGF